jgi:hypothetical protein
MQPKRGFFFPFQQMICRPAAEKGLPTKKQTLKNDAAQRDATGQAEAFFFFKWERGRIMIFRRSPFRFPARAVCLLVACSPCRATPHTTQPTNCQVRLQEKEWEMEVAVWYI